MGSILNVMVDADAFGPYFQGDSWTAWRVVLAALFALPMDKEQLAIYQRHTGRQTAPLTPFAEATLVVGRRGGKSRVLALVATFLATFRDYAPYLAPGEVATVAVIATDRKQARSIFRYIEGMISAVPSLSEMMREKGAGIITLTNRVVIEITTASFRSARGYTFAAVLADETAYWRGEDDSSANPDIEIFRALKPGLGTIPGSILLNASSPYRRAGVLWDSFKDHYGKDNAPVLVWKATTREMNANFPQAEVDAMYAEDPARADAEYGANFRTDIAAFITAEAVEACMEAGCYERARNTAVARSYVAFVDAAGGSGSDAMTMAIAHLEAGQPVLDAVRERKPPFSPEEVVGEFSALMKSYGITRATSDRWGGDWVGEAFRKHSITVEPSAQPKSDIYREALPLLNAGRCSLLDHPAMKKQLTGLERRTARGGRDSIDHGPGGHDDVANAVCGALVLAGTARAPMVISAAALTAARERVLRSNRRF